MTIREKVYNEKPEAGLMMDYLLFELVVVPNLNEINPEYTRDHLLDILWQLVEDKLIHIYYDENDKIFTADYDADKVLEAIS